MVIVKVAGFESAKKAYISISKDLVGATDSKYLQGVIDIIGDQGRPTDAKAVLELAKEEWLRGAGPDVHDYFTYWDNYSSPRALFSDPPATAFEDFVNKLKELAAEFGVEVKE